MSLTEQQTTRGIPTDIVVGFLNAMAGGDMDAAIDAVAEDLVYENVSLPTIRGKERFTRGARTFSKTGLRFEVQIHRVAENGNTVLTERTDALIWGPYRTQFWVCGTFEVRDGKVLLWRDYFDWWNIARASLRGLLGVFIPPLRARFRD